jgi:hypothetical protein
MEYANNGRMKNIVVHYKRMSWRRDWRLQTQLDDESSSQKTQVIEEEEEDPFQEIKEFDYSPKDYKVAQDIAFSVRKYSEHVNADKSPEEITLKAFKLFKQGISIDNPISLVYPILAIPKFYSKLSPAEIIMGKGDDTKPPFTLRVNTLKLTEKHQLFDPYHREVDKFHQKGKIFWDLDKSPPKVQRKSSTKKPPLSPKKEEVIAIVEVEPETKKRKLPPSPKEVERRTRRIPITIETLDTIFRNMALIARERAEKAEDDEDDIRWEAKNLFDRMVREFENCVKEYRHLTPYEYTSHTVPEILNGQKARKPSRDELSEWQRKMY